MKTEEQVIQQTKQLSENEKTLYELRALNNNIAQMLEYQHSIDMQIFNLSKDVKSIKTAATFFLIVAVIALFPLIMSLLGNIFKLF